MNPLEQYEALHSGAGVLRRTDRGRLILGGEDRRPYLHGLLTNDIIALRAGTGCYAALLTAQGRMISDMRVFELGDRVLLDLDVSLAPVVRDHLDRFIITEDVTVDDATASLAQVGVYGPKAAAAVAAAVAAHSATGEAAPDAATLESLRPFDNRRWDFEGSAAIVLRTDDMGVAGFEVVIPIERADGLERAIAQAGAVPVRQEALEIARVEAGIPRFFVDMDTSTIPLEAGIEDRAISMTKGCYVGQEVIIRVLHRGGGRVAKKLVALRLSAPAVRDAHVFSGDREVGRITSAVESPRFGPIALGYLQRDFTEPATELRVQSNGSEISARVAER